MSQPNNDLYTTELPLKADPYMNEQASEPDQDTSNMTGKLDENQFRRSEIESFLKQNRVVNDLSFL